MHSWVMSNLEFDILRMRFGRIVSEIFALKLGRSNVLEFDKNQQKWAVKFLFNNTG